MEFLIHGRFSLVAVTVCNMLTLYSYLFTNWDSILAKNSVKSNQISIAVLKDDFTKYFHFISFFHIFMSQFHSVEITAFSQKFREITFSRINQDMIDFMKYFSFFTPCVQRSGVASYKALLQKRIKTCLLSLFWISAHLDSQIWEGC